MIKTIQDIGKETLLTLKKAFRQVFAIHLFFVAVGSTLFAPLTGLLGQFLLELSGKPMLADLDIVYFFLTPVGMATTIFLASLGLTILIFEQASLMAICLATVNQKPLTTTAALLFTFKRIRVIFSYAVRLVIRLLFITLPFLGMAVAIVWVMLSDYDINYYLALKPPIFFIAAITIAAIVATMIYVLIRNLASWALALPLTLFSNESPGHCFTRSEELTHGHRNLLFSAISIWFLISTLISGIFLVSLQAAASLLAPFFFNSINILVTVLGIFMGLWFLGNLFITTFTSGSIAAISVLFYGTKKDICEPIIEPEPLPKNRLSGHLIILILIPTLSAALLTGILLVKDIPAPNNTMVIAHRGAAGKAPENSIAALTSAIKDGADWIEIDVQESEDGEILVIHDSDFMKLSNNPLNVWNGSLEEIKQLDIGSWFGPQFSGERVPTLQEVLELARGRCRVLIELKYYGHNQHLERRVAEIVEKLDMVGEIAIMSLEYKGIEKFRSLRPDWPVGLLLSKAIGKISEIEVDFLAINMTSAKPAYIRRIQESGKQIFVWTVNDPASMSRIMALGVDAIITDEPALARQIHNRNMEMTPVERILIHTAALINKPTPTKKYRDDSP